MDKTARITWEAEFGRWLLSVLEEERNRLRGNAPRKGRRVVRQTRDASFAAGPSPAKE